MAVEIVVITAFLVMFLVFVGVVIHRGVGARIRIDDVAHQAARAASIERTPAAADAAARSTAATSLAQAGMTCASLSVSTSVGDLRPGSSVGVTVSCVVDFGDARILDVPEGTTLTATSVEPVDRWRATVNNQSRP